MTRKSNLKRDSAQRKCILRGRKEREKKEKGSRFRGNCKLGGVGKSGCRMWDPKGPIMGVGWKEKERGRQGRKTGQASTKKRGEKCSWMRGNLGKTAVHGQLQRRPEGP